MKGLIYFACILLAAPGLKGQFRIHSLSTNGDLTLADAFTNGVCTFQKAETVDGTLHPVKNIFTTNLSAQVSLEVAGDMGFYRAQALDLSNGREGFTNLTKAYGLLSTVAGAGGNKDWNNWLPEYEGGAAVNAVLSGPHIAIANRAGEVFIADKDAHAVRKVQRDGTIVTVAGINAAGDGAENVNGAECALNSPNGLWLKKDGTVFILEFGNHKVRRLDTNGTIRTFITFESTDLIQRGLWVSEDETVAYVTTFTNVLKWVEGGVISTFSTGYVELGNIFMDPWNNLVITDRMGHRVYRLDSEGNATPIAGNGTLYGGGDGALALETGLEEVRGVWFLPTGAYLLCTHKSSRVWYVDTSGYIHLLLNGYRGGNHAGDGTWFYNPNDYRVSKCRAVTVDYEGNILLTENDGGYVRKIRFLPME